MSYSKYNPYTGLPDYQFWRKEEAIKNPALFDPVVDASFKIEKSDPVVTAGSCFAQHVSRYLASSGFNHLVTEKPHPVFPPNIANKFNYGVFTARYGNVYTAKQLKQLLQRSFGELTPIQNHWERNDGRIVDPFRPNIQENGFVSTAELAQDRAVHFAAVREALEILSVFVFTLGLTETWTDTRDNTVYPVAPGVAGGEYNTSIHKFINFDVATTVDDLQWCIDRIRNLNPKSRFIITVSPVPLNATAIDRHVFTSTTYSKAVLRVAAEVICQDNQECDYFPSYEIITAPYMRGKYYGNDCRSINESGVNHVMTLFLKHYGDGGISASTNSTISTETAINMNHIDSMQRIADILCDEDAIDNNS